MTNIYYITKADVKPYEKDKPNGKHFCIIREETLRNLFGGISYNFKIKSITENKEELVELFADEIILNKYKHHEKIEVMEYVFNKEVPFQTLSADNFKMGRLRLTNFENSLDEILSPVINSISSF